MPRKITQVQMFDLLFQELGEKYDVDWRFLKSVAIKESSLRPDAKGGAGEIGLMQIKPSTAGDYGKYTEKDLWNPKTNIEAATKHLSRLIKENGYSIGAEMYNVGEGDYAKGKRNPGYKDYVFARYEELKREHPLQFMGPPTEEELKAEKEKRKVAGRTPRRMTLAEMERKLQEEMGEGGIPAGTPITTVDYPFSSVKSGKVLGLEIIPKVK